MTLTRTQVSQLYVSLFGRASEGSGNAYWQTAPTSTGMETTAEAMLATEAARTYFGATLDTNQAFIEYIYLNTLGKTYAQDTRGVDFWVDELNRGKTKAGVVATLIDAAQHPDNAGAAQDRFNNRVAVSDYTADHIHDYTDRASFTGFIDNVTDDASTIITAQMAVDAQSDSIDNTYSIILTQGKDAVSGSAGNDLILGAEDTYTPNDTIDGGNGTDTLSLLLFAEETDQVTVTGVENILVRNAWAGNRINAGAWTGVDLITLSNSAAPTEIYEVRNLLSLALDKNRQDLSLTYGDGVLGDGNATQMLYVDDSVADLSINTGGSDHITALSVLASGKNQISLLENDISTISIGGAGNLELLSAADDQEGLIRVSSILGAGATGDLTLDMSEVDLSLTSAAYLGIETGSGNDRITVSAGDNRVDAGAGNDVVIINSNLDAGDLLAGGAGNDVLTLRSADFVSTAQDPVILGNLTGFEAVGISDALDLDSAMDVSVYGVNAVVIGEGISGDAELTGFSDGALIEIQTHASETDVLTLTMPGATDVGSNSNIVNIFFNADLEAGDGILETALGLAGINQLFVTTADSSIVGELEADQTLPDRGDGYGLRLTNDGNLRDISVSGDHAFAYAATLSSRVETLTAQRMTGNMSLDFLTAYGGTQGIHIRCGEGDDLITGSVYADLIFGGGGNDTIHLSGGSDQLTGGGGGDTFVIDGADISTDAAYSTILDFTPGLDTLTNVGNTIAGDAAGLDVSPAEALGGSGMTITADLTSGMIGLSGADAAQINTLDEWLAVFYLACESGKTAGFEFLGDTYIAEEAATGDAVTSLVRLAGVEGGTLVDYF